MSISSFTMVTMLDSRPAPMTITMPRTNDIPNRVITFKDVYGAAPLSTVTLVTQGGDIFENGLFSTILSNAYDTVTFHAGLPGRWHRTGGTNIVGGMNASSTFTNSLSTTAVYARNFYGDGSQLTGVLTTGGTTTFSNIVAITSISNNGWLSNFGGATFSNGLTVASGTTTLGTTNTGLTNTQILSNTGAICNSGMLSNVGTGFFNGLLTVTNGLTVASGVLNTTTISNTQTISTLALATCNAYVSSLTFFDPNHSAISTGTFRYSTLTTLFALPNTSLLYFNNLVIGGAYVWPGQTIQALNWTSGCNAVRLIPSAGLFSANCNLTPCNWSLVTNISGGTPPYFINDLNNMSSITAGINLYVTNTGLICNNTTVCNGLTNPDSSAGGNFVGSCNFAFTLTDSSTPKFTRSLRLII